MGKLRYLVISLTSIALSSQVLAASYAKPENLRFQNKSKNHNQQLQVMRDDKLCADDTVDQQNCPVRFYIDDIKAGDFYINNAAKFRLKSEIYNLKVKNCTDECSVCETDLNPEQLKEQKITFSVDASGLPLMLNADQQMMCEPSSSKSPQVVSPVAPLETTVQVNLAADTLFKFDGSSLNDLLPKGHQEVKEVAQKIKTGYASVRHINLVGHTDRLGREAYNLQLAANRAETVREVLIANGVDANIITTQSAGESTPVTDGCHGVEPREALKACLQPDRRVSVEITGISK